ncbi:YjeF N-terminal domain-containing protein [Spinellus fusiger]|nr:YjeF N-terminal domain-containing protein [Spinellus fusiger]
MASLRLSTPTPSQNKENKTSTSTSTITSSSTTTTTTIKVPASLVPPKARTRGSFQGYSPVKEGILASKSGPHTSKEASPNPKNMSPIFKQGSSHTHTPSVGTSDSSNVSPNVSPNVNVNSPTHTNPSPTVPPVAVSSPLSHNAYPNTLTHTLPVQSESTEQGPLIKTVAGGVLCPVITPEKMKEMETLCVSNLGPSEKMIIENAGYGASMMALKAIGGQRRIQPNNHNAAPLIVVLAGNNRVGSYSLAAARHLANRSCHVVLFLASDSGTLGKDVEEQKTYAESAGVKIVKSVDHLPWPSTSPVDLIIDALMGCQCTLMDLRRNYSTLQLIWSGMEWANNNKAPVLSIDFPSGVNPADGHPFHIMHYIRPKWTLCFGAPKMGCISRNITGELFLADIGIPSAAWPRVNGLAFNIPWGADFVLALEYQT